VVADSAADAILVERALSGDHLAFAQLARRHGPRLARTIRALGIDASAVEDVTQLALVAAWRALAEYDPSRSFAAWVSVIGANKARDWRRRQLSRGRPAIHQTLDAVDVSTVRDPRAGADAMDNHVELHRVARALDRLPEHLKVPMIMASAGGLTQPEIAIALGLSAKTIESRIARARARLVKLLNR